MIIVCCYPISAFITALYSVIPSNMFEPPRGLPRRALIHFVSRVNKTCVQMWKSDRCDNCHVTYGALLFNMIFTAGHAFCWPCSQNVPVLPADGPSGAETCSIVKVWMQWCWTCISASVGSLHKTVSEASGSWNGLSGYFAAAARPVPPSEMSRPAVVTNRPSINQHWGSLSGMQLWPCTPF